MGTVDCRGASVVAQLPTDAPIVDGTVNHRQPANGTSVAHVVHVANAIASATKGERSDRPPSVAASLTALTIEPDDFPALVAHTMVLVEQSALVAA